MAMLAKLFLPVRVVWPSFIFFEEGNVIQAKYQQSPFPGPQKEPTEGGLDGGGRSQSV